jgi:small-conductance mechanosensitive channel
MRLRPSLSTLLYILLKLYPSVKQNWLILFIHLFVYFFLFILFIYLLVCFVCLLACSFVRSFIHLFIHSFIIYLFIIYLFLYLFSYKESISLSESRAETLQILNKSTHKHPGAQLHMLANIPIKFHDSVDQILLSYVRHNMRTDGREWI